MNFVERKIAGTQCIDCHLVSHQTETRVSKPCFPAHSERTFVFCLQLSKPVKEAGLVQNRGFMLKRLLIVCVFVLEACVEVRGQQWVWAQPSISFETGSLVHAVSQGSCPINILGLPSLHIAVGVLGFWMHYTLRYLPALSSFLADLSIWHKSKE